MSVDLQSPVAFHLTGRRSGAELTPVTEHGLRPALFARYRDLPSLRYDFPLVLLRDPGDDASAASLRELVDRALERDKGADPGRFRAHALRLEREIRVMVANGSASASLRALLEQAAQLAAPGCGPKFADSLARLKKHLKADGEALDCDARTPSRLVEHAWHATQARKLAAYRSDIQHLALRLSEILRADDARSEAARTPASLKAAMGSIHDASFDFDSMSRLLGRVAPGAALTVRRRERVERTLRELRTQRFHPIDAGVEPYAFGFDDCTHALRAFRERIPAMARLARAITVARLEIDGVYSEPRHDALFEQLGEGGLDLRDLAMFPDYLVCLNAGTLNVADQGELMEILAGGLPMKILVQSDDILEPPLVATGHLAFGARSRQLAHMAIGLTDVFVLQSSASNLARCAGHIDRAMRYGGPALLSVFSGANPHLGGLPAYLNAAAAMESRAFPAFVYDPTAGEDWAARFTLDLNPQHDRDWPVHRLEYEDGDRQRVTEDLAFTLLDYVACDDRFSEHFAKVPRTAWNGSLAPVSECLDAQMRRLPDKLPTLPMIDAGDRLQKVIADERLLREARRVRNLWRSLQELGGVNNSHVAKALAKAQAEAKPAAAPAAKPEAAPAAAAPAPAAAPAAAAPEAEATPPSDEPYIETARCSTCNECTQINNRMFAYDENQQARIVDVNAGTYKQLVEAAENCRVAIIHPGKPKNPNEPGLEDLMKRAEAFQ